ncbi:DUF5107 domain-containing protein [Coraliomargarita algicola]|uniref:DUF5107 domain-containing protein n=1 Tax=Coraliomargarita algicola TaxID=3092156 RepID=A0ABZ0RQM1_9BACT|nr:DUF5107 domain-containing protein [Coraliomargarita sp. J2-16]WPJ97539.1 DUF5107 domain-containing protein [Coraliomargarita sp. J2-16]
MLKTTTPPSSASIHNTASAGVSIRRESTVIPTYAPFPADKNPMFLEKRVYQGSSGRVYPLPCVERFEETKSDRAYDTITIENEYIEVTILPELGGRIHGARDKTNDYDFVYRNGVIKPALIALSGSWISGGIEFNWPQHHRPSTFMPCDVEIEEHADGSKTVWMSEHDPLNRMKGMHGICLYPDRAVIELKVRAHNRTPFVQTFLWWANVAVTANEGYQSFLPTDVTHVADHAKGSTSTFPLCTDVYYGIDYAQRAQEGVPIADRPPQFVPPSCIDDPKDIPPQLAEIAQAGGYAANDLSWYSNIPVPTSYMCLGTQEDFFGGYDHLRGAGIVHVANHHISPGKKQWVWGNHNFGYAWDRNLCDDEVPYVELMAGVYTDNQPDFSFLQPGETKTWSQFWYPIQDIGPAQKASTEAALSLIQRNNKAQLGAMTTRPRSHAVVQLTNTESGKVYYSANVELAPNAPHLAQLDVPPHTPLTSLKLSIITSEGHELLAYQPAQPPANEPEAATEPPNPSEIESIEELYITGQHLAQYRHPTRMPEPYWEEALRRDPSDARTNNAVGLLCLTNGEFDKAEQHFRTAIARLTRRNPNPYDGEPYYNLGLTLRYQADAIVATDTTQATKLLEAAYAALYKSTWNQAWQSAAYHALAEIDCRRQNWHNALDHLDRSLRVNTDNLGARNLRARVLQCLDRHDEAEAQVLATHRLDPLDWWARHLMGHDLSCDTKTRLDLAHDHARAGFLDEALALIAPETIATSLANRPEPTSGTGPMLAYTRAWLQQQLGSPVSAQRELETARTTPRDYCFPSRIEDINILQWAIQQNNKDAHAPYYLGNLFYDRKRHHDAIANWELATQIDPNGNPTVWRNLGIAYYNVLEAHESARDAYERAYELTLSAGERDARLLFERDLLWKRLGRPSSQRLAALKKHLPEVQSRDDLSVEYLDLLNQEGRHQDALAYLNSRNFQPWEGGEGLARSQHVRTHLALGRKALTAGDAHTARQYFEAALESPRNLGESKHLLANQSNTYYWLGCALEAQAGEANLSRARELWTAASNFQGDFLERAVQSYSEMTYYSALSLDKLGQHDKAQQLFTQLKAHAKRLFNQEAKVYYFATSLPARLLFENLQRRQETTALLIEAQAELGLGNTHSARKLLEAVLARDPARALAKDLLSGLEPNSEQS